MKLSDFSLTAFNRTVATAAAGQRLNFCRAVTLCYTNNLSITARYAPALTGGQFAVLDDGLSVCIAVLVALVALINALRALSARIIWRKRSIRKKCVMETVHIFPPTPMPLCAKNWTRLSAITTIRRPMPHSSCMLKTGYTI